MIDTTTLSKRQTQVLQDAREFFSPKTIVGRKELQAFQHEKYNLNSTPQFITKNLKFKAVGEDGKALRGFYDISVECTTMDDDIPESIEKPVKKSRKSKKNQETAEMVATTTEQVVEQPTVETPVPESEMPTETPEPVVEETKKPVSKKKTVSKAKGKTSAKSGSKKPVVKKKVSTKGAH